MAVNRVFLMLFLAAVVALSPACQDHHFKSYEEMGPLPEPDPNAPGPAVNPIAGDMSRDKTYQREPAGGYMSPAKKGFAGVIASGSVDVAPEAGPPEKNWTLYVIARPAEGGPPLAATRLDNVTFPARFTLTEKDMMMGDPTAGMKLSVEAMYDSDGDPISKSDIDLFGKASGDIAVGAENVAITLAKRPGKD